jgi:hypothetical protein
MIAQITAARTAARLVSRGRDLPSADVPIRSRPL